MQIDTSAKIRTNAFNLLEENYNSTDQSISLKEWVELEMESDPSFYTWLFPAAENINDFRQGITNEQSYAAEEFINSI